MVFKKSPHNAAMRCLTVLRLCLKLAIHSHLWGTAQKSRRQAPVMQKPTSAVRLLQSVSYHSKRSGSNEFLPLMQGSFRLGRLHYGLIMVSFKRQFMIFIFSSTEGTQARMKESVFCSYLNDFLEDFFSSSSFLT